MDNIGEYSNYWETNMFYQTEELDSWVDEAISGYYDDSSSPDMAASSSASKNIVSERNRRKKLNDRLLALRAVVPNISKMDKASIIKDAIEYIQQLHDQERMIRQEILELESSSSGQMTTTTITTQKPEGSYCDFQADHLKSKKKRTSDVSYGSIIYPIEVLELRVTSMGERTLVISLTCSKRSDTMVKICEVFESLKLKIITANVTAFSGRLLKTVFIEAEEDEKEELELRIKTAIATLNDTHSPMCM